MVYCGKPSQGCSACRGRKIRCDQAEPACGQCVKRQKECPGYRNMTDLMFRDESNHVIKKATKPRGGSNVAKTKKSKAPARRTPLPVSSVVHVATPEQAQLQQPTPPSPLTTPVSVPSAALSSSLLFVLNAGRDSNSPESKSVDDANASPESAVFVGGHKASGHHNSNCLLGNVLSWSLQEQGTAYFFSRYVATDNGCYQNYDFIYDVWKPPSSHTAEADCVTASIAAVGLAGLSKVTKCHETMTRARQSYGVALRLSNAALRDPTQAATDRTMLAVLVLGTYEFISGRTPQTLVAWKKHVDGAAALASIRGTQQFQTTAGVKMFLMLCNNALISCVQSGLPMPQPMLDLRQKLGEMGDTKNAVWRLIDCVCRALRVRYEVKVGNIRDRDDIVQQLCDVENDFAKLVLGLSRNWRYRCVQLTEPHPGVSGRWCHVYPGLTQATCWNGMRTMRIIVQETILQQLDPSGGDHIPLHPHQKMQLSKAVRLMDMLHRAVLASVPQHFGIVSSKDIAPTDHAETSPDVPARTPPYHLLSAPSPTPSSSPDKPAAAQLPGAARTVQTLLLSAQPGQEDDRQAERFLTLASASNTILWPLYTLGTSSMCSEATRDYVIDRLDAIYTETGLEQARNIADMVRSETEGFTLQRRLSIDQLPTISPDALPTIV